MSWKVENWLAENCDLPFGVPRALLFAMANQASDEGSLMAKNGTYMKRLNVTERSVQRATAALVKGGWIKKIPDYSDDGRQLCNVYRVVMPATAGGGRVTPASPSQGDSSVTLPVTPSVTPRVTPAVTPIKNQTDNPHGESLTPPTPLAGGAATSAPRVTQAERKALDGLQTLRERLWAEQQRHIDRKIGRAIKSRLRAGESVESLWADYFAPEPPAEPWDPPPADEAATDLWRRVVDRLRADGLVTPAATADLLAITAVSGPSPLDLVLMCPSAYSDRWCREQYTWGIERVTAALGLHFTWWVPREAARRCA